ncbi:MAG: hypothetical protein H0V25_03880, partial [Solirubrobacterales bacterium]|nr:hypothetical protein [Solirubrobacterales bacterium]
MSPTPDSAARIRADAEEAEAFAGMDTAYGDRRVDLALRGLDLAIAG